MKLSAHKCKSKTLKASEKKKDVKKTPKLKLVIATAEEIDKRRVRSYNYAL